MLTTVGLIGDGMLGQPDVCKCSAGLIVGVYLSFKAINLNIVCQPPLCCLLLLRFCQHAGYPGSSGVELSSIIVSPFHLCLKLIIQVCGYGTIRK